VVLDTAVVLVDVEVVAPVVVVDFAVVELDEVLLGAVLGTVVDCAVLVVDEWPVVDEAPEVDVTDPEVGREAVVVGAKVPVDEPSTVEVEVVVRWRWCLPTDAVPAR
jgi:hypothetical protein